MSMVISQQEVKLDEKKQNTLIQKASNIMLTGEDDVSYLKVLAKLNKRQTEEIGTEKSPTKPLYLLKQKIEELKSKKKELEQIVPIQYEIENEKEEIENAIIKAEKELEILHEIQKIQNDMKIEEEKIKINEKSKIEIENKKKEEEKNLENIKAEKTEQKKSKILYIILILSTIFPIILFILNKKLLSGILASIEVLSIIILILMRIKEKNEKKKIKEEERQKRNSIKSKIEILENEIKEKERNILEKRNEIEINKNLKKEELLREFGNKQEIDNLLKEEISSNNIIEEQKLINDMKLELTQIRMKKEDILKKVENSNKIEEELINLSEELQELINYNDSINIAKEALENANMQMRQNVTPRFTVNLSNAIKNITNGKYKTVKVNEQSGLIVEMENGNYVPADILSLGTIDELYLSLRISSINELVKENMPIILDETFAYFDKERMENVLEFLNKEYKNKQILILTCTDREKKVLENMNITYQEIAL